MSRAMTPGAARIAAGAEPEPPENFVRLSSVAPHIRQDLRYAGADNFTGRPVPGYGVAQGWLRREAAEALAAAAADVQGQGLGLIVYDCYRPQRATRAFIAWAAADDEDPSAKARYYPNLERKDLFDLGYIARESTHSTGTAVDLAVIGLDFGTPFDLFDAASNTFHPGVSDEARRNRERLLALMERRGFVNLDTEWWHFSLDGLDAVAPQDFELR